MKKTVFTLAFVLTLASMGAAQKQAVAKVQIEENQSYLVLSTNRLATLEKELDEAAAKNFRVLYAAPTLQVDMAMLLKRVENPQSEPYRYKVMATLRNKTMEREINDFAKQGYRLLPRTVLLKPGFITNEMVILMEREPLSSKSYEYKLLVARDEGKMHNDIDAAQTDGFAPITMLSFGKHTIVMEKETSVKP